MPIGRIYLIIIAFLTACTATPQAGSPSADTTSNSEIYDATKDPKVRAAFMDLYEAGRDDVFVLAGKVVYRPAGAKPWKYAHVIETAIQRQRQSLAANGCLQIKEGECSHWWGVEKDETGQAEFLVHSAGDRAVCNAGDTVVYSRASHSVGPNFFRHWIHAYDPDRPHPDYIVGILKQPRDFGPQKQLENLFVAHCSRWEMGELPADIYNPARDPQVAPKLKSDILAATDSQDPDDIAEVRQTLAALWDKQDQALLDNKCTDFRRSNQTRNQIQLKDGRPLTISRGTGPTERHPTEGLVPMVLNGEAYHRTPYTLATGTVFRGEALDLEDVFAVECLAYMVP